MTLKPCIECGEPSAGPYCDEHGRKYETKPPEQQPHRIGYDHAWRRLSAMARRLQPWCTDCGTREDLTTDHTPEAWARKAEGKGIRLTDVAVVCRSCNSKRGRARPYATGDMRATTDRATEGSDPSPAPVTSRRPWQSLDLTPRLGRTQNRPNASGGMS